MQLNTGVGKIVTGGIIAHFNDKIILLFGIFLNTGSAALDIELKCYQDSSKSPKYDHVKNN